MTQHIGYMHVVPGSTRWYCIAEGCTTFIVSDDMPLCDRHAADYSCGMTVKFKTGLTMENMKQYIRNSK